MHPEDEPGPRPAPLPAPKLNFAGSMVLNAMRLGMQIGGRLTPGVAADWACKQYYSPRRYPASRAEKAILERAASFSIPFESHQIVDYPGGDLAGWSWGEEGRPTVLLCHGWESRGSWIAATFVEPLLEQGYRVVTFDMPGHGRSPGEQAEVKDMARAIHTTADQVGNVVAVVAHSAGAATTSMAIESGKLSVGKVVYIAPVCWMLCLPERFLHVLRVPPPAEKRFWELVYARHPRQSWIDYSGDVIATKLTLPGLIFHDDKDAEIHFEGSVKMAELWDSAELVQTSGLGHRRIVRDPDVIARAVAFIGPAGA